MFLSLSIKYLCFSYSKSKSDYENHLLLTTISCRSSAYWLDRRFHEQCGQFQHVLLSFELYIVSNCQWQNYRWMWDTWKLKYPPQIHWHSNLRRYDISTVETIPIHVNKWYVDRYSKPLKTKKVDVGRCYKLLIFNVWHVSPGYIVQLQTSTTLSSRG